jgi:hypothetical protein
MNISDRRAHAVRRLFVVCVRCRILTEECARRCNSNDAWPRTEKCSVGFVGAFGAPQRSACQIFASPIGDRGGACPAPQWPLRRNREIFSQIQNDFLRSAQPFFALIARWLQIDGQTHLHRSGTPDRSSTVDGLLRRRPGLRGAAMCGRGLRVGLSSYRSFSCFSPARSLSAAGKSSARSCAMPPPRPARRTARATSCSRCRTAPSAAIWPSTIRQRNYGKPRSCSARRRDRVGPYAPLGASPGARTDLQLAVMVLPFGKRLCERHFPHSTKLCGKLVFSFRLMH